MYGEFIVHHISQSVRYAYFMFDIKRKNVYTYTFFKNDNSSTFNVFFIRSHLNEPVQLNTIFTIRLYLIFVFFLFYLITFKMGSVKENIVVLKV